MIASMAIGATIAILFGRSILGPLQQVVVMIKELHPERASLCPSEYQKAG